MITFGSLFAGIGGFDLALERAGMRCAWQADNDANCNKVLRRHWPNVRRYSDVRDCGRHNLEPVDILVGGFPCQDLSVAGRREGLDGERSGLWYEFARIIGELEPRWVVVENVPGLLSSGEKRDMGILLGQMAERGYMGAWRCLDAQWYGVAQRRRRVFIVGHLGDGRAAEVLFERTSSAWHPAPSREAGAGVALAVTECTRGNGKQAEWQEGVSYSLNNPGDGGRADGHMVAMAQSVALRGHDGGATAELGDEVATALRASQGGGDKAHVLAFDWRSGGDVRLHISDKYTSPLHSKQASAVMGQFGVRRLTPRECERLQGFPDDFSRWGIDEDRERVELSDSARYRMLGNAVAVPVVEWIGRRIAATENHTGQDDD